MSGRASHSTRSFVSLVAVVMVLAWLLAGCHPSLPTLPQTVQLAQADPRQMRFEPVEFNPPEPERIVLENGLVVYLLEDHELPLATITATIRTGAWLDPQDKIGLAALAGVTMRTGGTGRMSAAEVDEELERLAAQISVGIGTESGSAMLDVLKKDLPHGLRIFADILMTPAFDPARVELAKLQAIEAIRRRQDQPQSIAGREFAKFLYGATHPYARENTVVSVTRISRDDLLAFHARTVHPNGIILGVTGDFEKASMLAALREAFGAWSRGEVPPIVLPPVEADEARDGKKIVRLIGKGTSQTHLRAGHLSVKENDPDYPALSLLNDILGGSSFRSRLFQDVRTKQGLAYSVGSRLQAGVREQGVWLMRAETKLASTQEVISRLVANMERLREQPVTDAELAEAKEAFVNSFVFSFTSPSSIVSRLIGLEYDGLPKDFLQQLRDKVVKLTKEDLLRAARTHLHPDRLRILAVGPPEALAGVLSSFGEVKEIKLPPEG
ncbi:MAG: insulinase family protein [Nitrospirae bacterium]|nr:insulinase family protein [Nitrospirota bacterium]